MWDWIVSKIQAYASQHKGTGGGGGFWTQLLLFALIVGTYQGTWERIGGWLRVWIEGPFGGGGGGGF